MHADIHVLIADDEEPFALNLKKLLETRGYKVSAVFDGYQAMERIREDPTLDLVILDVMMPGMDGIATLEQIKNHVPDMSVIMLTGHATLSSGIQAIRKGAYDYLMKPCDIEDLLDKIQEAYDVKKIKKHPVLWPRRTVEEMMVLSFDSLKPENSLRMALEVFNSDKIEKAGELIFIMEPENRLVGYVTKRALIDEAQGHMPDSAADWTTLSEHPEWLPDKSIRKILQTDFLAARPDETLTDIAHQMMEKNFRQIPVLDKDKVVGILRMQDILHYIDHEIE